jgi:hypothetical protein
MKALALLLLASLLLAQSPAPQAPSVGDAVRFGHWTSFSTPARNRSPPTSSS